MNARVYEVCTEALRDNWVGEITPGEAVDIMFTALDEEHDTTVTRTKLAREEATVMAAQVFSDLWPEPVDYSALVSNVLRAIRQLPLARKNIRVVEALLLGFDTCLRRPLHGGHPGVVAA